MLTKLFAGLVVLAGVSASGLALAGPGTSCCYPGSECCYPGSPCCADCCYPGSPCCVPGAACCESFASADAPPASRTTAAAADDRPAKADLRATKLVVDDMTCAGCAKAVTKAVSAVAGVEAAAVDLKTKTLTVTPKAGTAPSPKGLWEAVEKAGYKPTRLDGPAGTFEKTPAK